MATSGTGGAGRQRVGRYFIDESLGIGPTGEVFRAKAYGASGFEGEFALKRFHADLLRSQDAFTQLANSARLYASLDHLGVATLHEFGVTGGATFTATELIHGVDLKRLIVEAGRRGISLGLGAIAELISQAARAVAQAHRIGLCHLGICPNNLLCDVDGEVKVADFGVLAPRLPSRPHNDPALDQRTPYLSPEQLAAEATSPSTDVYQLAVVACEILTGKHPFSADSAFDAAHLILSGQAPNVALPAELVEVLHRALARVPSERYADATGFADAFDTARRAANLPGTRAEIAAAVGKMCTERQQRRTDIDALFAAIISASPVTRAEPVAASAATVAAPPPPRTSRLSAKFTPQPAMGMPAVPVAADNHVVDISAQVLAGATAEPENTPLPSWDLSVESSAVTVAPSDEDGPHAHGLSKNAKRLWVAITIVTCVGVGYAGYSWNSPDASVVVAPRPVPAVAAKADPAPQPIVKPVVAPPVIAPPVIDSPEVAAPVVAPPVVAPPVVTPPVAGENKLGIATEPKGAFVYVNGKLVGTSPVELPWADQSARVAVIKPGFRLMTQAVSQPGNIGLRLEPVAAPKGPAGIKVMCVQSDRYYVFIDGKDSGQLCPTDRLGVEVGSHDIEIYDPISETRRTYKAEVLETRLSKRVRVD